MHLIRSHLLFPWHAIPVPAAAHQPLGPKTVSVPEAAGLNSADGLPADASPRHAPVEDVRVVVHVGDEYGGRDLIDGELLHVHAHVEAVVGYVVLEGRLEKRGGGGGEGAAKGIWPVASEGKGSAGMAALVFELLPLLLAWSILTSTCSSS